MAHSLMRPRAALPFDDIAMLKADRQQQILELVNGGSVSVADLADRFKTSALTIRRDLRELQNQGLLSRTHGGARLNASLYEYATYEGGTFEDRFKAHSGTKQRIAERAAQLVSDGDSLLLNGGSTMTMFARALRNHRNLTAITNSLTVALEIARSNNANVIILPGVLEKKKMTTYSNELEASLSNVWGQSVFLGVTGLNLALGPTMNTPQEALAYRAFVRSASEVTLLVDSTKFESGSMFGIAPLSKITRIITDSGIREIDQKRLAALDVEVITVPAVDDLVAESMEDTSSLLSDENVRSD